MHTLRPFKEILMFSATIIVIKTITMTIIIIIIVVYSILGMYYTKKVHAVVIMIVHNLISYIRNGNTSSIHC